jgi:hypothetical protein
MERDLMGHRWSDMYRDGGAVMEKIGYCCQGCGATAPVTVVICRPGDESLFTSRYGAQNVRTSTSLPCSPGEAFAADGRMLADPCPKPEPMTWGRYYGGRD